MNLGELGARVRAHRTALGLSQKALAQSAGVSVRFLVQVERGDANPSVLRLGEIASALGVSVTALVTGLGPADAVDEIAAICQEMPLSSRRRVLLGLRRERAKLALVGLRGAGKTSVGSGVAASLGCPFVELDRRIEEAAGMSLAEVFEFQGAEGYRSLARGALEAALAQPGRAVIAIGGSLVADAELYAELRDHCQVVWLRASPEEHLRRVQEQGDLRPMAGWADPLGQLRSILAVREPLYALADRTLDTDALGLEGTIRALSTGLRP